MWQPKWLVGKLRRANPSCVSKSDKQINTSYMKEERKSATKMLKRVHNVSTINI